MKFHTLLYLLNYRFFGVVIAGVKRIVIAISTATSSYFPIAIGAGKTGINSGFLNPLTKSSLKILGIGIKAPLMSPGES